MKVWGNGELKIEEEAKKSKVTSIAKVDNHLYFYNEVNNETILELNKILRRESSALFAISKIQDLAEPTPIYLHINSYGGTIMDGFAAMDEILKCKVPVNTIIDGCCASAATLISVVGNRRYINRHASMLIHQLSHIIWGKYSEFVDEMQNLDMTMKMLKSVYKEYTKIPMKQLNEILKHDIWFTADQCIEYGIVDEIL